MEDERLEMPSASGIEALALCPGRSNACRGLKSESTPASKRGDLLHKAYETGLLADLDIDEQDFMEKVKAEEARLLDQWMAEFSIVSPREQREQREWIHRHGEPACSGKLDVFWTSGRRALILDLKSGWKRVTVPSNNWQLRTEAVALWQNYDVDYVRVAIVQPFCKAAPPCDYELNHLEASEAMLFSVLDRAKDDDAPRIPGQVQCQYCPAKTHNACPEAHGTVTALAKRKGLNWDAVPTEEKLGLWDACQQAKAVIEAIESGVRSDLQFNPQSIPGLKKLADQKPREVESVTKLFQGLVAAFPENPQAELAEKFTELCSVSVGEAQKFYRALKGCKVKEAEEWLKPFVKLGFKRGAVVREET